MPKRVDVLWDEMWELKDKIELESEFQKVAETNDDMRELWSEYELLKNEEKPERLPTKDEYYESRHRMVDGSEVSKEWSGLLYLCPLCGGSVRRKNDCVFMTYPPRYLYECNKCGHQDTCEF